MFCCCLIQSPRRYAPIGRNPFIATVGDLFFIACTPHECIGMVMSYIRYDPLYEIGESWLPLRGSLAIELHGLSR